MWWSALCTLCAGPRYEEPVDLEREVEAAQHGEREYAACAEPLDAWPGEGSGLRPSGQRGPRSSALGPARAQDFGARAKEAPDLRRLGQRGPRTSAPGPARAQDFGAPRALCRRPYAGPGRRCAAVFSSAASVAVLTAPAASSAGNCAVPTASPPLRPREPPCSGCLCAAKPKAHAHGRRRGLATPPPCTGTSAPVSSSSARAPAAPSPGASLCRGVSPAACSARARYSPYRRHGALERHDARRCLGGGRVIPNCLLAPKLQHTFIAFV